MCNLKLQIQIYERLYFTIWHVIVTINMWYNWSKIYILKVQNYLYIKSSLFLRICWQALVLLETMCAWALMSGSLSSSVRLSKFEWMDLADVNKSVRLSLYAQQFKMTCSSFSMSFSLHNNRQRYTYTLVWHLNTSWSISLHYLVLYIKDKYIIMFCLSFRNKVYCVFTWQGKWKWLLSLKGNKKDRVISIINEWSPFLKIPSCLTWALNGVYSAKRAFNVVVSFMFLKHLWSKPCIIFFFFFFLTIWM